MKQKASTPSGFAHATAIVETKQIGAQTRVWAFSHVQPEASIGSHCNIGENCFIENGAAIGDRVTIKNGVCIWKGVVVGNNVFIGPNATFTNDHRPRSPRSPHVENKYRDDAWLTPILLGEGCTVGANATIIGPVVLGRFCFVAAGCVVIRNVEEFELVAGNPCRRIGWVNEQGERIERQPQ